MATKPQNVKEKIKQLNDQLEPLREQRDKLNKEAHKWMEKRDETREQIKNLRDEIADLKQQRDEINQKVKDLKLVRDQLVADRQEKLVKVLEFKQKLASLKQIPSKAIRAIQSEIEGLEWRIQTSSLTLPQEKRLVEQIGGLEKQLASYKQAQQIYNELNALQQQLRNLRTEEKRFHNQISENAQQSRQIHETMAEKGANIPKLKAEAEEHHKKYIEFIRQAESFDEQCLVLVTQIRSLRGKVKSEEEKKKTERETIIMQELETKALEKLKSGKKLTWEEFKILAEKGLTESSTKE